MDAKLHCGIEGGATKTNGVLINGDGQILAKAVGEGTNHWQVGYDCTVQRILTMVTDMLSQIGSSNRRLSSIGLSLSGADSPECSKQIATRLIEACPLLLDENQVPHIYNDSIAALESATDKGGIVLIAGTGSNCRLVEVGGNSYNCGGWGHAIGDEGSAYWIAHKALKVIIDHDDRLQICDLDVTYVREAMCSYFHVNANLDVLPHLYTNFSKPFIANFTRKIYDGAIAGDRLCLQLLSEAGAVLARHILAVCCRSSARMFPDGVTVVCVGSVWNSWEFMRQSFCDTLRPVLAEFHKVTLVRLIADAAVGAAVIGARHSNFLVPIDYTAHARVYHVLEH